jgi:hypothetical protein
MGRTSKDIFLNKSEQDLSRERHLSSRIHSESVVLEAYNAHSMYQLLATFNNNIKRKKKLSERARDCSFWGVKVYLAISSGVNCASMKTQREGP